MKYLFLNLLLLITYSGYSQCIDKIEPDKSKKKLSYQNRGSYCEGFYTAKVSSPSLDIVGFVMGDFKYKLGADTNIDISVPASTINKNTYYNIRVASVPLNSYYRMDAKISPSSSLLWSLNNVVFPENISSDNIGVYSWYKEGRKTVYSPIKYRSNSHKQSKYNYYSLELRASREISKLFWRYTKKPNGKETTRKYTKNNNGYSSGEKITLKLENLEQGEYEIEIDIRVKASGQWKKRKYKLFIP